MECELEGCEAEQRRRSRFCSERCYQLDYSRQHAAKRRETASRWRRDNPDRKRAANKQWARDNPATFAALRASRRGAPGPGVSNDEWVLIKTLADHRCSYCGHQGKMTMDHVVPLFRGGIHSVENVVPACKSCNSSKGARDIRDWAPGWIPPPWVVLP